MLVFTRKLHEKVRIADTVELEVLEIRNGKVKLGFVAPWDVPIHREELAQRIEEDCRERVAV